MAISASSYAVGNRLYKGATSAPTRGRVDPTGYVDRELNKVASRSGIASAALRRMGSPTQTAPTSTGTTQAAPSSMTAQSGSIKSAGGGLGASQSPLGGALRISPVGKLQAAALNVTQMPFDPEQADAQEVLMRNKNKFDQDAVAAEQGLERDYTLKTRQVEQEQPNNQRRLLENYAGRGMAYSSGYNYDQGEMQNQYAGMLAGLQGDRTNGLADLLRQRGQFNDDHAMQLSQIQKAAARRAAEQAAQLALEQKAAADAKAAEHAAVQQEQYENPTFVPDGPVATQGDPHYQAPANQNQSWYGGGAPRPAYIPQDATFNNAPLPAPEPAATFDQTPMPMQTPQQAPAQQQPMDLVSRPGGTRTMASFDPGSQQKLSQGGTIVGGNGYTYKFNPLTGQAERVK